MESLAGFPGKEQINRVDPDNGARIISGGRDGNQNFGNPFNRLVELDDDLGGGRGRGGGLTRPYKLYGPFDDYCSAFVVNRRERPVTVYPQEDMGDNFAAPRFWADSQLRKIFNGGAKWYWTEDNVAIRVDTNGNNLQRVYKDVADIACATPPRDKPHTLEILMNYGRGANHPAGTSVVTASNTGLNGIAQGSSRTTITLPYGTRGTQTISTFVARAGGKTSSTQYRLVRVTANGQHTIQLFNGNTKVSENVFTDPIKKSDGKKSTVAYNVAFPYEKVTPPPKFLNASPSETSVGSNAAYFNINVDSSTAVTIVSKPSWVQFPGAVVMGRNSMATQINTTGSPRSGKIVFRNGQGLTDEVEINQQTAVVATPPLEYSARIQFNYLKGENAPSTGLVSVSGAPQLNGGWPGSNGGGSPKTIKAKLSVYQTRETALYGFSSRMSTSFYQVKYKAVNGGFEIYLYKNNSLLETNRFSINISPDDFIRGNVDFDLVPQDDSQFDLKFDFAKIKDIDPPKYEAPELVISVDYASQQDSRDFSSTRDSIGKVILTTLETSPRTFELNLTNQSLEIHNGGFLTYNQIKSDYKIEFVLTGDRKITKLFQKEPNSRSLLLSSPNSVTGNGTEHEWQLVVGKKVVENKTPQVFPGIETIEFNIKSTDSIGIPYTSNAETSQVDVKLPDEEVTKQPTNGMFTLKSSYFKRGLGRYIVNFCPYASDGTKGPEKQVIINVIDKTVGYYPDIRDIRYPKRIQGADFVGLNVPFEFSFQSVFTDYVKVYLHDKNTRIGGNFSKVDKVKLNVQDLVKYSGKYKKNKDVYQFEFLLVPYGQQGSELLEGNTEKILITFDEGDLKLDRNKVIMDICDSLAAQLNVKGFDEYTSRYLTHLVHFGDTNNEVISNWEQDTETFREYEIDPETKRPTNVQKPDVGFDALVLKLYEPLDTVVQPNQQVWITKIQSEPQIHEVIIRDSDSDYCPPLAAPNFSLDTSTGMGYELLDDMLASGTETNATLVNTFVSKSGIDTKKLDIQYVSGAVTYNSDLAVYDSSSQVLAWERFSHFGSAEERVKNFWYKASQIENFVNVSSSLESSDNATTSLSIVAEKERQIRKINEVKAGFDGFENFLYTNTSSLSYPKDSNGALLSTGSSDAIGWYDTTVSKASRYDYYNINYLSNNIPQYVKDDEENSDFILFLDMIGHHFDILWTYTKNINRARVLEHKKENNGVSDELVREMLRSFGYKPKSTMDTAPLWEFALGQFNNNNTERPDGSTQSIMTGKDRQAQIWRRILNNLPYIYKSKGTSRGLKAILSTYGISDSILRIQEFGGPPPSKISKPTRLTEKVNTFGLKMTSGVNHPEIIVPWHTGSGYPQTIEFSLQTDTKQDGVIFRNDMYYLEMIQDTGSLAKFKFHITGSGVAESMTTPTIPFFNEEINSFMIRRSVSDNGSNELFELFVKEPFQERIRSQVSSSLTLAVDETGWKSGSELVFGGFDGEFDNLKLWRTALSESIFDEHVLAPDMYNGNSVSSSTVDLFVNLDFEVAKDLSETDTFAPSGSYSNVAPDASTLYGETHVTMSNFSRSSTYPYESFAPKEVERTRVVPSTGLAAADKISLTTQVLKSELSPKARASKSNLKDMATDSNRIGMFISPTNNINRDITKALGSTFKIDDFIGDPCAYYDEEYHELKRFRQDFFKKYTINYDGFYNLIKYIDSTLFDTLMFSMPGRSKSTTGLLIEPHLLERNKKRNRPPSGLVFEELVGVEDISKNSVIEISSTSEIINGELTASELNPDLDGVNINYETTMSHEFVENLSGSNAGFDSTIDFDFVNNLSGSYSTFDGSLSGPNLPTFASEEILANNDNDASIIFNISSPLSGSAVGQYVRDSFQTVPPPNWLEN